MRRTGAVAHYCPPVTRTRYLLQHASGMYLSDGDRKALFVDDPNDALHLILEVTAPAILQQAARLFHIKPADYRVVPAEFQSSPSPPWRWIYTRTLPHG